MAHRIGDVCPAPRAQRTGLGGIAACSTYQDMPTAVVAFFYYVEEQGSAARRNRLSFCFSFSCSWRTIVRVQEACGGKSETWRRY